MKPRATMFFKIFEIHDEYLRRVSRTYRELFSERGARWFENIGKSRSRRGVSRHRIRLVSLSREWHTRWWNKRWVPSCSQRWRNSRRTPEDPIFHCLCGRSRLIARMSDNNLEQRLNLLRWQLFERPKRTYNNSPLDRNYWKVINLSFVLSGLYLNIYLRRKILQLWDKKFWTCLARHSSARG